MIWKIPFLRKKPWVAVDVIVDNSGKILLIKRNFWPFRNYYALPGGMVEYGETVEQAARREVYEETGIKVWDLKLLGVFSDPRRDPRRHVISIAFYTNKFKGKLRTSIETKEVVWLEESKVKKLKLAFDHNKIINHYLRWKYGKPKEKG